MNKNFRVIWSKARGALMVVNEMTSSVQAKGTKTVIAAAAAALISGAALAAEGDESAEPPADETPAATVPASPWTDVTLSQKLEITEAAAIHNAVIADGADVTVSAGLSRDPAEDANHDKTSKLDITGGQVAVTETGSIEVNDLTITGGTVAATGTPDSYAGQNTVNGRTSPSIGAYQSFKMTGGKVALKDGGRLWIGNTWTKDPSTYGRMALEGGEVQMNGNAWITGNKRLIAAGTYYAKGDIDGCGEAFATDSHEVTLDAETFAYNTIGFDGAAVKVSGTGNTIDAVQTELTAGSIAVAENADLTIRGTTATNEPAETQHEVAAMIRQNGYFAVTGGTLTIAEKGTLTVEDTLGRVNVTGGSVQNAGTFDFAGTDMTIENAAFENTGMLKGTGSLTIGQDGVLKTAAAKSTAFDVANVTLNEGGTLAFTALNSTWDDPATPDNEADAEGAKKDQLLLDGTNYILAGGTLTGADNIKIGRNNTNATTLTVTQGDYTFKRVRLGNAENANLTIAGGSLTVTDLLDLRYGKTRLQGGTLALDGDYLFGDKEDTFTMEGGKLATTAANLFEEVKSDAETKAGEATAGTEEGDAAETPAAPTYELSELLTKGDYTGGIIEVTDEGVKLSQKDVAAAVQMLADAGIGSQLVFGDLTFTDDKITFDDGLGLNGKDQTVYAPASDEQGNAALEISGVTAAVGKLVVDKDTQTITVVKSEAADKLGTLMITGMADGGNVIEGADVKTIDAGALILGYDEASRGTVNADEVKAESLEVRGDFSAKNVTTGGIKIEGAFTAEKLALTGMHHSTVNENSLLTVSLLTSDAANAEIDVSGTLAANRIETNVTLGEGATLLIGDQLAVNENVSEEPAAGEDQTGTGEEVATKADEGTSEGTEGAEEGTEEGTGGDATEEKPDTPAVEEPAKPSTARQIAGIVNTDIDGTDSAAGVMVTTNANGRTLLKSAAASHGVAFDETKNAGLYADKTIGVDEAGQLNIGNVADANKVNGGVALGSDAVAVIDLNGYRDGSSIFQASQLYVDEDAKVVIDGADRVADYTLVEGGTVTGQALTIETNTVFLNGTTAEKDGNTVLSVAYIKGAAGELDGIVEGLYMNGTNQKNLDVLEAVSQKDSGFTNDTGLTDHGVDALSEYFAAPVTAGAYNAAYDAAEQVNGTLRRHAITNNAKTGDKPFGVWADVFYASNEAKKIYGGQGYSGDVYGASLGFDFTASCGATVGAALSIGSADMDSENSVSDYSNDADFWGLSLYTSQDFSGLGFSADMSYLWLDNDLSGRVAGVSADESLDSSVFTVGFTLDAKVWENSYAQFVPHVGLRYTRIDMDDYRGFDSDTANVFEMPVGFAVSGKFQTNGWKITPSFDFTFVPQIGDTDVNTVVGDIDFIDNTYNTTLGIQAEAGNFTLGGSFRYGFGSDDRSNAMFNVNAAWRF